MMRHDTCSSSPLSIEAATEATPNLISGKIRDWHWQRQAIVYIRQCESAEAISRGGDWCGSGRNNLKAAWKRYNRSRRGNT